MSCLVVNFFGGPGSGKSTLAYELIGKLKRNDHKAELVVEHAKWLTYNKSMTEIKNQVMLAAHDYYNITLLKDQVDFIVLDGSILNGLAYTQKDDDIERQLAIDLYSRQWNIGYMLPRKKTYMKYGRRQSEDEAKELDENIFSLIDFLPLSERKDLRGMEPDTLVEYVYNDVLETFANGKAQW